MRPAISEIIATTEDASGEPARHLTGAPGSEWTFWRWVCLRSAGFPVEGVLKLAAAPDLVSAVDEAIEAMQALENAREKAAEEINSALDDLRSAGRWNEKATRKALLNARGAIHETELPSALPDTVHLNSLSRLETAIQRLREARACFRENFSRSSARTTEEIRDITRLPAFREALSWQNRSAARIVLDRLANLPPEALSRSSRQRQSEELIASYWQRYCVKNDTIGFFGPVGWARFRPEVEHLCLRPGHELVTARKTYWETWAMEALGETITKSHNIQPWIAPILMPFIRIDGMMLRHPLFEGLRLTPRQAALFRACDGRATARQIATGLLNIPGLGYRTAAEVYEELRNAAARGFLVWKFNIPLDTHPENILRQALQRIDDTDIRKRSVALLDQLESARVRLEKSAGNAEKVDRAFGNLEREFTRLTGVSATRGYGKAYSGRTLVYEDCRRDAEVLLGPELLKLLDEPLSLLLTTGRWFTARVAEVYHEKFLEIYTGLVKSTGSESVDAALCWSLASGFLFERSDELMIPLQEEFRGKWENVLELGSSAEPVSFTCDELRTRIMKEFSPAKPGWIGARYHSPDIMIAADSVEAIQKGDYFFVMGEVHVSANTLGASLFVNQHPSPGDLMDAVAHDLGDRNVMPTAPRSLGPDQEEAGSRTVQFLIPASNFRLEYMPDSFVTNRVRALPVSSLILEKQDGKLMAKSRDGRFSWNVIDLVGGVLSSLVMDCFRIMVPRRHAPRISVGRLVIKRESWRFSPEELEFARCSDPAERFLQARRWARLEGIPRFGFFKVPVEKKPSFIDFDSPILVDIFGKMIRRTIDTALPEASIDISEMLPATDQLWLMDSQGRRYTSELRLVAVDSAV